MSNTKEFKVGQLWLTREGNMIEITNTRRYGDEDGVYPIEGKDTYGTNYAYTLDCCYYNNGRASKFDLVWLVKNVDSQNNSVGNPKDIGITESNKTVDFNIKLKISPYTEPFRALTFDELSPDMQQGIIYGIRAGTLNEYEDSDVHTIDCHIDTAMQLYNDDYESYIRLSKQFGGKQCTPSLFDTKFG